MGAGQSQTHRGALARLAVDLNAGSDLVERLFARNERLVCYFDTAAGPMALVLVGAMVVAGIETVWSGQVAPPLKAPVVTDYQQPPAAVELAKGEEMGRFNMGSTVILLFEKGAIKFSNQLHVGNRIDLGDFFLVWVGFKIVIETHGGLSNTNI